MEGHLEVVLKLFFFTQPLKFRVETHMEAPLELLYYMHIFLATINKRRKEYTFLGQLPSFLIRCHIGI
jgi:hypothetical protein